MVISIGLVCGCAEKRPSAPAATHVSSPTPTPVAAAPPVAGKHQVTITRAEYGDAWPFTVESGTLTGSLTGRSTSGGTELTEVTFTSGGMTYYVNGIAKTTRRYAALEDIWASDTSVPKDWALKKNIGPIIERGLKLAKGTDEPFVAPKPTLQPAVASSDVIRCDQFEVLTECEPNGTDTIRRTRVSIKTDLPDSTNLMVSIGRTFRNSADNEEYSVDYLEEKSTVADWRAGKILELDQTKWQAQLDEKRSTFRKLGEKLEVVDLSSAVIVSFVVPVNQSDKRFGLRNVNHVGLAVVNSSELRIVRRESKLEWPVTGR